MLTFWPFILNAHIIASPICRFINIFQTPCLETLTKQGHANGGIANIIFALTSLILIIIGVAKSPKTQTINLKFEKRLISQTLVSSIFLIIMYLCIFLSSQNPATEVKALSFCFYLVQYYPSMFLLFIVSPCFRKKFAEFYRLNFIFCTKKIGNLVQHS